MKVTKLNDKRLLFEFPSKREMNLSCFRITEFNEGPAKLFGEKFSADDFIDSYADDKGDINYFSYWEGHNWSKAQLMKFFYVFAGQTSQREKLIMYHSKFIDDDAYIISIEQGDKITLRHELAHGLFFDNDQYLKRAIHILGTIPHDIFLKYKNSLLEMKYSEKVIMDEAQAYLAAFDKEEWDRCFGSVPAEELDVQIKLLNDLFNEYNK